MSANTTTAPIGVRDTLTLGGDDLTPAELYQAATGGPTIALDDTAWERVAQSRQVLEDMVGNDRVIYGVNTGVGGFVSWLVPLERAGELQINLLNAVATNVGRYLDEESVRAIMIARITSLARGNSAISAANLKIYLDVLNAGIVPCVPEKGSLGTSGDLGPLAAIALVCAGQWKATYCGELLDGRTALSRAGMTPMTLGFKEGLALINGTSGMVGLGSLVYERARRLAEQYSLISALSIEALLGKTKPFDPRVHTLKPHPGQQRVAEMLWTVLADSRMALDEAEVEALLAQQMNGSAHSGSDAIEDAYSLRCTPQILGPVLDSLHSIGRTLQAELNSSNDNPLVIPEEAEVFHNGHFHGQYVAMAMDHLMIDLATLSNLANRRIDRFLDAGNSNGLPPFLCDRDAGVRLGLMGGQFMTASLTAENRAGAVPISIQSLTSTGDFQDIVSFGFVGARHARELLNNTAYVIAFELICACQAADIRGAEKLSSGTRRLYDQVRRIVPFLDRDVTLTDYVETLAAELLS